MTNKKFKLAAMSLALTACVAASPLAANAESAGTEATSSTPAVETPAPTAETSGENAPTTNETKQNPTDETKQESTDESKKESTDESKKESTDESKQESTDESKKESTDESKKESTDESKKESTGETKQESTDESKKESTDESKKESTNESKQTPADEAKQESTNEAKQESTNESKQESTNEAKQESTNEAKQESTNEAKQESTNESKQESTNESKQESTNESKQESTDETKQNPTDETKQEAAVENNDLAVAPAPVLMLAKAPAAPTGAPTAPAEDNTVATITGQDGKTTGYTSFDEAVKAAQSGDTIKVTKDTETDGMDLHKNLTIQGVTTTTTKTNDDGTVEETTVKPKLTFKKQGIALWGTELTFKDMQVEMTGVGSTPYTAEWGWMTICASKDAILKLDNTDMTMDGTGTAGNTHAIYFCSNNKLNVQNGSNLTIKNYKQDALEWDGGDGGYNCNITGGSTFTSDNNRSGFTGTFYVTVDDSDVKVINSRGNGSNGSHYNIKNGSNVNFSGNGSHGLSAGNLTVQDSTVTAENNGLTGIIFTGKGEISDHSTVTITGTKGKSYWNAGLRLMKSNASLTIKDSTVTIKDNAVTGIFCDSGSQLTIEDTANVTVTNNNAEQENCSKKKDLAKKGGGLVVRDGASAKLGANTTINNNSAALEGADIFIEAGGKLTFSAGNAGIGDILQDCGDGIDGWYIDAEGQRWDFHGDPSVAQKLLDSKDVALEYNGDGTYTITAGSEGLALKAAHAELPAPTPDPDGPDNPNPNPNPKPEPKPGPDTPVTPEDPQLPPVQDARADTPDSPVLPSSPTNPAVQDAHALPQTGTSLFAALAMALSGFALTIAGAWASLLGKNSRH